MKTHVYVVYVFRTFGEPFGNQWQEEYFDRTEAEAARERYNAQGGLYAREVFERPYKPAECKSNFIGASVRWDMPPVTVSHYCPLSEHHERYYGEK